MFRLIVTNDEEVVKFARERGAGIFAAEKSPEGFTPRMDEPAPCDGSKIYRLMRALDFNMKNKGYVYIKFLMEKCEADPKYHEKAITKEIYPDCAKQFETTPDRVERAIRHELHLSFKKVPEKYSEIFGGTFTRVPMNSEFIGLVSEYFANN